MVKSLEGFRKFALEERNRHVPEEWRKREETGLRLSTPYDIVLKVLDKYMEVTD